MADNKDLLNVLWSGADVLRGKMDANEYKTYLLGLINICSNYKKTYNIYYQEYKTACNFYVCNKQKYSSCDGSGNLKNNALSPN